MTGCRLTVNTTKNPQNPFSGDYKSWGKTMGILGQHHCPIMKQMFLPTFVSKDVMHAFGVMVLIPTLSKS